MMKRSPMNRRSGFKRTVQFAPTGRQWEGDTLPGPRVPALRIADGKARMVVPIPKRAYVRSKALMKAYRKIRCQQCGKDDGTVCGAHSNWAIHGKGRGIKADDNRCASLCSECHTALDSGPGMTAAQRRRAWWGAHVRTVNLLIFNGLWPDSVPMPAVHEYPKEWA